MSSFTRRPLDAGRLDAAMDIGVWLRGLGLSRYEAAFRDNSIGPDIVPDLTGDDLEKLSVTLGDRKRLLKAIASLCATETAAKSAGHSFGPHQPTPPSADS